MDTIIGQSQLAEKVSKKIELPDDIMIDILCRLPVKIAMICRLVCRRWRDLTLTQEFVDLHLQQHSIPMIIATSPSISDFDLFFIDKWWESAKNSSRVHRHRVPVDYIYTTREYGVLLSHAGLVAVKQSLFLAVHFYIINPVNLENVRITLLSDSLGKSEIYGVFLHPLLKEYCSLWKIHTSKSKGDLQYKIINLGPNEPSSKTISYPIGHRSKRMDTAPLLMDNFLYWMLEFEHRENGKGKGSGCNDIMEYDIAREEFNVMACPVPVDSQYLHDHTHLLVIDGTLSFLLILPIASASLIRITIWRLENRAKQLWTSAKYKFMREIDQMPEVPRAAVVVDGKLAFLSGGRLYVCDLMQGLIMNSSKQKNINAVLSHQMSFASLRNCMPIIRINQDGQVVV